MKECILDILKDTFLVFPAVFLVYILIELFEHKVGFFKNGKFLKKPIAPLYGAVAGIVPQCGISVMAAKLYEKKLIRAGTLFAVFIATSDEAIILLISNGKFLQLAQLIICKLILAIICGFSINLLSPKFNTSDTDEPFEHEEVCAHCHNDEHHKEGGIFNQYLLVPLKHSLVTIAYVLAVNTVFSLAFYFIGEDKVVSFMEGVKFYQPAIVALIGLIPNCASSVLVTQLYLSGGITFASCFAGLVVNAGLGFAILFRNGKEFKRNLIMLIGLYLIGVISGLLMTLIS